MMAGMQFPKVAFGQDYRFGRILKNPAKPVKKTRRFNNHSPFGYCSLIVVGYVTKEKRTDKNFK